METNAGEHQRDHCHQRTWNLLCVALRCNRRASVTLPTQPTLWTLQPSFIPPHPPANPFIQPTQKIQEISISYIKYVVEYALVINPRHQSILNEFSIEMQSLFFLKFQAKKKWSAALRVRRTLKYF